MSFAEDDAEGDFPVGDDGAEGDAGAAGGESGGIDLSKFVSDAEGAEGDPCEDVTDEELEKVVPLVADDAEVDGDADAGEAEAPKRKKKAAAPVDLHLRAAVEAVIFAADEPVTPPQVAKATGSKPGVVKKAILEIQERLDSTASGLMLQELGGGFTFTTHAEHAPAIRALRKTSQGRKLSPAAIDTLAIVAYKQPVQRQEIEDVRGVASCGPMLRQLMQLDLVKIVGRAEVLGKPLLYGTTKRFLDMFGLADIKDLPKVSELEPQ